MLLWDLRTLASADLYQHTLGPQFSLLVLDKGMIAGCCQLQPQGGILLSFSGLEVARPQNGSYTTLTGCRTRTHQEMR